MITLPAEPIAIAPRKTLFYFCALLLLCRASAGEPPAPPIDAFIDQGPYKNGHWGLLIVDLETGDVLYQRSPDRLFAPASVTKVYSVAAALDALGADYRFETPIYARGEVNTEGLLDGDLILVASGDPTLGGRATANGEIAYTNADHIYDGGELTSVDPLAGLNELARAVRASGVHQVRGEVIVDDRLFEHASGTGGVPSLLTPMVINDNLIDIVITAAVADAAAEVVCRPNTVSFKIDAQVRTAAAGEPTRVI